MTPSKSRKPFVADLYGFTSKESKPRPPKSPARQPVTPQRRIVPVLQPRAPKKTRKTIDVLQDRRRARAVRAKLQKTRARRDRDQVEVNGLGPIEIDHVSRHQGEATLVMVEGKGSIGNPFTIDDDEDTLCKPYAYACLTAIEKLNHNLRKFDAACEQRKRYTSNPSHQAIEPSEAAFGDKELEAEDDEWIENNREWDVRALKLPQPVCEMVSDAALHVFEAAFHRIVFGLGYEDTTHVVKAGNAWLSGTRIPFRHDEALMVLAAMEQKGQIRVHEGKVYLSEAFDMLPPSKVNTTAPPCPSQNAFVLRPPSPPPSLAQTAHVSLPLVPPSPPTPSSVQPMQLSLARHTSTPPLWLQPLSLPISPTRIAAFRKILGSLILGPVFAVDGCAKLNAVLSAVNKASPDEFSIEEADRALEALMKRNEAIYTGGMVYII